jgi:hypothetical protein
MAQSPENLAPSEEAICVALTGSIPPSTGAKSPMHSSSRLGRIPGSE